MYLKKEKVYSLLALAMKFIGKSGWSKKFQLYFKNDDLGPISLRFDIL